MGKPGAFFRYLIDIPQSQTLSSASGLTYSSRRGALWYLADGHPA
jgi:hypothetical protein